MIQDKKYKLLKDLPITLAGIIFIQKESNPSVYKPESGGSWLEEIPEELVTGCPEWFELIPEQSPLPEKIEVDVFGCSWVSHEAEKLIVDLKGYKMNPDKFPAIKSTIESVLNGKEEDLFDVDLGFTLAGHWKREYEKLKSEVDTIRKETFIDARKVGIGNMSSTYVYPTISDYLQSLTPETKPKEQDTKEVLFTTEDGKEIRNGDWAFYVEENNNWMVVSHSGISEKRPYPYFSTKEAAHDWIVENKPCLSAKEIYLMTAKYGRCMVEFEKEVEQKSKQKLKQ